MRPVWRLPGQPLEASAREPLSGALRHGAPALSRTGIPGDRRASPTPALLLTDGCGIIAGSPEGSSAPNARGERAPGVLLLDPWMRHLPRHLPPEICLPLAGGGAIYHGPHVPQATRAADTLMLAV